MSSVSTLLRCSLLLSVALLLMAETHQAGNFTRRVEGVANAQAAKKKFVVVGRLKEKDAAKGIGKTRLRAIGLADTDSKEALQRGLTVETDADGAFRFEANFGRNISAPQHATVSLAILEGEFTFAMGAIGWQAITVKAGEFKMGDVLVVKGGQIRVDSVHQTTGEPIGCPIYIWDKFRYINGLDFVTENGTGLSPVLPEGTYSLRLTNDELAGVVESVSVKPGQVTDVQVKSVPKYFTSVELYATAANRPAGFYARPVGANDEFKNWQKNNPKEIGYPAGWGVNALGEASHCFELGEGEWEFVLTDAKGKITSRATYRIPLDAPARIFASGAGGVRIRAPEKDDRAMECSTYFLDSKSELFRSHGQLQAGDSANGLTVQHDDKQNCALYFNGYTVAPQGLPSGRQLMLVVERDSEDRGFGGIVIMRQEIAINAGEVVEIEVARPETSLQLRVSSGGRPAAKTALHIWNGPDLPDAADCLRTTDAAGALTMPAAMDFWYVATPKEFAWLSKAASRTDFGHRLVRIRQFRVTGLTRTHELELTPVAWVKVSLTGDLADDFDLIHMTPFGSTARDLERVYESAGDSGLDRVDFEVGPVPPGRYLLEACNDSFCVDQVVDVSAGDCPIDWNLKGNTLKLTATFADGASAKDTEFVVRTHAVGRYLQTNKQMVFSAPDGTATCVLPSGEYLISARHSLNGEVTNVGSLHATVIADSEHTISLSQNTGGIWIAADHLTGGRPVVVVFESGFVPPDKAELIVHPGSNLVIHGVPDGRYKLELQSDGHLPVKVTATVKKGELAKAAAETKATLKITMVLADFSASMLYANFEAAIPLSKGRELDFEGPEWGGLGAQPQVDFYIYEYEPRTTNLTIGALPPTTDAIRIKIKGFAPQDVPLSKANDHTKVRMTAE